MLKQIGAFIAIIHISVWCYILYSEYQSYKLYGWQNQCRDDLVLKVGYALLLPFLLILVGVILILFFCVEIPLLFLRFFSKKERVDGGRYDGR